MQTAIDIWPSLPLDISVALNVKNSDEDDIIGAQEHRDRIAMIHLGVLNRSQLKKSIALMQEPFPVLKSLGLEADEEITFVIPDAFLGGSAPLLQRISLSGIPFSHLPKLLSSTSDLSLACGRECQFLVLDTECQSTLRL